MSTEHQGHALDAAVWELIRRTSATAGERFFRELTRSLAQALDMRVATVSEVIAPGRVRTLALWSGDDWGDAMEYDLAGTPCGEIVESGKACVFRDRLRERFPDDPLLEEWAIESYAGTPLVDPNGEVIGHLCLLDRKPLGDRPGADVLLDTFASRAAAELDRVRKERALNEQRGFLRQVLDINPSLIFAKDRAGRFTLVNRATAEVYGTTVEDLTGKTDADFNPNQEEVAFFRKMDLEVMDTRQERFIREEPVTEAGGRIRWVQTIKRPIVEPDGRVEQVLGVATDITELKQTREELLRQQKHERDKVEAELDKVKHELVRQTRLAAIGQVAASIAHELRNPLGSINNAVYILQRRDAGDDPKLAEYLGIIRQEIEHADLIVRNLLEMSRAKDPVKRQLALEPLLRDTFKQLVGDRRIELRADLEPGPYAINADPDQLRQVLNNLITNAIQALDDGGTIRVEARAADGWRTITLADDGPGVAAEVRDCIFEPLFTTRAKGTGLGLAICRQIVERHGGTIELVDAPRGAAFRIRLPDERGQSADRLS